MGDNKAIIVLDDVSRGIIKTSVSELSLYGIIFVNNLEEITSIMLQSTQKVIVLEGFLANPNSRSKLRLYKALLNLTYFFLGKDDVWLSEMGDIAHTFRCDISLLNYDMVQAALFRDMDMEQNVSDTMVFDLNKEFAQKIIKDPSNYDTKIQSLASAFLSERDDKESIKQTLEETKKRLLEIDCVNAKLTNDNDRLLTGYKDLLKSAAEINESLREYEVCLTKDVYDKLDLHTYINRPQIIYLKEYEELIHFNSFIETLVDVLKIQDKKSVKVIRLFDSSDNNRILTLPSYYKRIYNSYISKDVINADYLVKSGDYTQILDLILTNRSNLDVLIVIDSKSFNDTVLNGSMLNLGVCRNVNHLNLLGLVKDNTVTNGDDDDEYLCWKHYKEFSTFSNKYEKLYECFTY